MMNSENDHDHTDPPSDLELRVKALESLLVEKGFVDRAAIDTEYSYLCREFNADDGIMQLRFEMSFADESPITDFRDR